MGGLALLLGEGHVGLVDGVCEGRSIRRSVRLFSFSFSLDDLLDDAFAGQEGDDDSSCTGSCILLFISWNSRCFSAVKSAIFCLICCSSSNSISLSCSSSLEDALPLLESSSVKLACLFDSFSRAWATSSLVNPQSFCTSSVGVGVGDTTRSFSLFAENSGKCG